MPLAAAAPIEWSYSVAPTSTERSLDDGRVPFPFIEENCVGPYRFFCVGPFDMEDVEVPVGFTRVRFAQNDTGALALFDQSRTQAYGPYIINNPFAPTVGDDVNVCNWQCLWPNPLYARAHSNMTVEVTAADRTVVRGLHIDVEIGKEGEFPLPEPFGCPGYQYPCD